MSSSVPPPMPPSGPPPPMPNVQAPLPPGKKPNVVLWIVGGVVVIMIGFATVCGIGAFFVMKKAKDAGFDSALLSKNPGYATAKLAATMNPEIEVLSSDDDNGTIKVRNKRDGKTMTMKFDPDKKVMVVTDENGKEATVRITGEGDKSGVEVKSADGNATFSAGGGNQMPAWVPVYPGSSPQGTFATNTNEGSQNGFTFKTGDPAAKVIDYYQTSLKSAGFTITMNTTTPTGGMVMAEDAAKKKSVMLTMSTDANQTAGTLMVVEKK